MAEDILIVTRHPCLI